MIDLSDPQQQEKLYDIFLACLCVWREARNQPHVAKLGVAYTIANRAATPSWWGGPSWSSVILKPWQFSSFNHNDPNAVRFPIETDTAWMDSCYAVRDVIAGVLDPTQGATSYFDKSLDGSPPTWSTDGSQVHVTNLGDFRFYRRA